jgi:hypothetical protein
MTRTLLITIGLWMFAPTLAHAACLPFDRIGEEGAIQTVVVPEHSVLHTIAARAKAPGEGFSMVQFPDIPAPGFQPEHVCSRIQIIPFRNGKSFSAQEMPEGTIIAYVSLLLDTDVDFDATYPALVPKLREARQFGTAAQRQYKVFRFENSNPPNVGDPRLEAAIAQAGGDCVNGVIRTAKTLLVPVC